MARDRSVRELYVAVWPVLDDTRALHVLVAEAAPRLNARIRAAGCLLADSPAWAICSAARDLPATIADLAANIGLPCGRASLPEAFGRPRVRATLAAAAPVLRALPPTATDPMPTLSADVRELNRCGWSTAQIADRMQLDPDRIDFVRAACRIEYALGPDGL